MSARVPSAGVGRTGTFIVIDGMIDMMHGEQMVDVFGSVSRIREQRCQLIQTDVGRGGGAGVVLALGLMELTMARWWKSWCGGGDCVGVGMVAVMMVGWWWR